MLDLKFGDDLACSKTVSIDPEDFVAGMSSLRALEPETVPVEGVLQHASPMVEVDGQRRVAH